MEALAEFNLQIRISGPGISFHAGENPMEAHDGGGVAGEPGVKILVRGKSHFSLGGEWLGGFPPLLQYKRKRWRGQADLQKFIICIKLGEQDRILRSLLFILMANE